MTNKINNQSQFELFPANTPPIQKDKNKGGPLKDLTFSAENIIVLCIVFVMVLVFCFSFGVDRGKKVVKPPSKDVISRDFHQNEDVEIVIEEKVAVPLKAQLAPIKEPINVENEVTSAVELSVIEDLFTVQVASFKNEENAQREAQRLQDFGEDIFVLTKGSHSIVCIGKFNLKENAKELSHKLKSKYNDCLVRRL